MGSGPEAADARIGGKVSREEGPAGPESREG
jgi:hypothetical protein